MNIIEMSGVKKDYPLGNTTVHALRGVDFTVEEGEFLRVSVLPAAARRPCST